MRRIALLASLLLITSCRAGTPNLQKPTSPFSYVVDLNMQSAESLAEVQGRESSPIAAVEDGDGVRSIFVVNEVLISPKSDKELRDFLSRYGGKVTGSDEVPPPHRPTRVAFDAKAAKATEYVVRVDLNRVTLDTFPADAERMGIGGLNRMSSEEGVRLLALVARERSAGLKAVINFVSNSSDFIFNTEEGNFGGTKDAFSLQEFSGLGGSRSNVTLAWQFIAAHGVQRHASVAIIDGGFWLDSAGEPLPAPVTGGSDLPSGMPQYDFVGGDYFAGDPNVMSCELGGACPWHGNGSAGVVAGALNNKSGSAGTGGMVTDPILFKVSGTNSDLARALRTAVLWGADVVSMSFSEDCDAWCLIGAGFTGSSYFNAIAEAQARGVLLVAAAGNGNKDVLRYNVLPCILSDLCIGALMTPGNTRFGTRFWSSNYGGGVNMWSPTDIRVMPDGATSGVSVFSGTSAATPFVAGVAAMMKAVNPLLNAAQLKQILIDSAWKDSPDANVGQYVNAYAAVVQAANGVLARDVLEPNDTIDQATRLTPGRRDGLTIDHGNTPGRISPTHDRDYFRFTLADYSQVVVDLDYMPSLSVLNFALTPETLNAGPAINESRIDRFNGRTIQEDVMAPGTYRFLISSNGINQYNLALSVNPKPLAPDEFEVNDSIATAAKPTLGAHLATLHQTTDVDFYKVEVAGSNKDKPFSWQISMTDQPLTIRLYQRGTEIKTDGPSFNPGFVIPDGSYVVKVEGAGIRTRYAFNSWLSTPLDLGHSHGLLVDKQWLVFPQPINPGDPGPDWLVDERSYRNFIMPLGMKEVVFNGIGLHVSLFDQNGQIIADGERSKEGVESLSLKDAKVGQNYTIRIERNASERSEDRKMQMRPIQRYGFRFR